MIKQLLLTAILFLLLACCVAPCGQAARQFNGTSHSLSAANVDLSGVNKLSLAFWLWWDSYANNDKLAFEFSPDINSNPGFIVDPNSSTGGVFEVYTRVTAYSSAFFTRPSAGAWHHYVIVIDMSKSSQEVDAVYVDGASQSLTLGSNGNNTGNWTNDTLYFMSRNNSSLFGAGKLAEVALYPGIKLTADDVTALFKGASPQMVRPTDKHYYWPLLGRTSPEPELFFGRTATVNSATQADHPRVFLPR
jgi:hypothetical protein